MTSHLTTPKTRSGTRLRVASRSFWAALGFFPSYEFYEPGTNEPYVVDPGGLVSDPDGGGLIGRQGGRLVRSQRRRRRAGR